MKKVIMIVTNRYDPDIRVHKEAKYLVDRGFDVEVLCWDRENDYINSPTDKIDGVKVRRFFPYAKCGTGIRQIRSYFKFILEIKKYLSKIEFNYLHCHDLDGAIAGYSVKSKKSRLIFDMHEFYEMQKEKLKYKEIIRIIVNYLQNKSDAIIYVNEVQIRHLNDKLKSKSIYLPNYPNTTDYLGVKKSKNSTLNISYIGVVRQFDELKNLMEACNSLENVFISIHGDGRAFNKLNSIKENYVNTKITGRYNPKESSRLYSDTDISYIVYSKDNPQHMIGYPVKFFEAIITKTPVIVTKGSVLEGFISEHDIGFAVDGESVEEIKDLVSYINANRQVLREKIKNIEKIQFSYSWEEVVKNLENIYNDTL
ncbi:glycosyltransferase [Fusibacter tunisiensis]|uniref:Glycosyltransferase involved in cell wall biosynthesis n=1 Tax=Fusibacter tunisiensis TaxID=1008308 RepID=A0ABS2MNC1_9FIRM|nr:glycosyltransferase [Fusibacter tunisiensis]MBM7560890.1 glycosyltransferase involved in cell wall biosynthesis [Fusibacter tunisiensis]